MICKIKKHRKSKTNAKNLETMDQQAISLYGHIKEISKLKYDAEIRRENSLILQSSHMQTAFSFMTAAIFMAAPIMIANRGTKLSLPFFFTAFSSIILCLIICLTTASLAQRRYYTDSFMDIPNIQSFVEDTYKHTLKKSEQLKQWVQVVGEVQVDLAKVNNKRVTFIRVSMMSFLISICMCIFWFIVAVVKLL